MVLFRFFSVWTSTRNSSHSKIMSTMRSWEAKNCLITHSIHIEPCKCLIKAIIRTLQEPVKQVKIGQNGKTERNRKKPKKTEKNQKKPKKTSPKFEICGSVRFFLGCNPPLSLVIKSLVIKIYKLRTGTLTKYTQIAGRYIKISTSQQFQCLDNTSRLLRSVTKNSLLRRLKV